METQLKTLTLLKIIEENGWQLFNIYADGAVVTFIGTEDEKIKFE